MTDINPIYIDEVVASLSDLHRRALFELDTFYGRGPRHLSGNLNISIPEAREVLQHFQREGICDYGSLCDEDEGLWRGRGYWLDTFGHAVRDRVEREMER